MGLVVTTSQIRQVCTFRIKQMVSTISLPQIYIYSNLKKLLGNNLAQKGKKKCQEEMVADAPDVCLVMAQPQA